MEFYPDLLVRSPILPGKHELIFIGPLILALGHLLGTGKVPEADVLFPYAPG